MALVRARSCEPDRGTNRHLRVRSAWWASGAASAHTLARGNRTITRGDSAVTHAASRARVLAVRIAISSIIPAIAGAQDVTLVGIVRLADSPDVGDVRLRGRYPTGLGEI